MKSYLPTKYPAIKREQRQAFAPTITGLSPASTRGERRGEISIRSHFSPGMTKATHRSTQHDMAKKSNKKKRRARRYTTVHEGQKNTEQKEPKIGPGLFWVALGE